MKTRNNILIFSMMALSVVFFSCKKEGCTDSTADNYDEKAKKDDGSCEFTVPTYNVTVTFEPKVNDADYSAATVYEDGSGNAFTIDRLDFYVSEMKAKGHDGETIWEAPMPMIFKLGEESSTFSVTADNDHWHSLSFGIGVPANLNTQEGTDAKDITEYDSGHPLAIQTPGMHWSWNSGYIFLAMEGQSDTDADDVPDSDITYHIGTNAFFSEIEVDFHMDIEGTTVNIVFEVHIDKLLEGVDVSTEVQTHSMGAGAALAQKIVDNFSEAFELHSH